MTALDGRYIEAGGDTLYGNLNMSGHTIGAAAAVEFTNGVTLTAGSTLLVSGIPVLLADGSQTVSGTLSISSSVLEKPSVRISGESNQYKFIRFQNNTNGVIWDISMDRDTDGNRLAVWNSPDGNNWTTPFIIDTNGVIYANGAGLTNLAVGASEFTPVGSLEATTIQAAIEELENEKLALTGGTLTGSLTLSQNLNVQGTVSGDGSGLTNLPVQQETDTLNSVLLRGNTSSLPIIVGSEGVTNIMRGDALSLSGGELNNLRSIGDQDLRWIAFGTNTHHNGVYWYLDNDTSKWWSMVRGVFGRNTLRISQTYFSHNPAIELYTNGLVRIWTDNHIDLRGSLKQGYEHNFVLGSYSHAAGYLTESIGDYSHSEGKWTHAIGESSHSEGVNTEASGYSSHSAGENAKATNDNTFVWSDSTQISSTTNSQFTVYAANGIRLLGGTIYGNGAGLTNLPSSADNLGSHTATQNLNMAGFSITNAAYYGDGSHLTGIDVSDNLGNHTATADIEMGSTYKVVNLPDPVNAQDAVNYHTLTNYISQTIAYIPEMGDLSMGTYTNQP